MPTDNANMVNPTIAAASLILSMLVLAAPLRLSSRLVRTRCAKCRGSARKARLSDVLPFFLTVVCALLTLSFDALWLLDAYGASCTSTPDSSALAGDMHGLGGISLPYAIVTLFACGMLAWCAHEALEAPRGRAGAAIALVLAVVAAPVIAVSWRDGGHVLLCAFGLRLVLLAEGVVATALIKKRTSLPSRLPSMTVCLPWACAALRRHTFPVSATIIVLLVALGVVTVVESPWEACHAGVTVRAVFFGDCCALLGILVIWVLNSRRFSEDVEAPCRLWDDEPYLRVVEGYRKRCGMVGGADKVAAPRDALYGRLARLVFWFIWLMCCLFSAFCTLQLRIPAIPAVLLVTLLWAAMLLNGSSYYLCAQCVWLVKEASKRPGASRARHFAPRAALSTSYQRLRKVSRRNYLFFFIVVALFSITMLLGMLAYGNGVGYGWRMPWASEDSRRTLIVLCTLYTLIVAPVGFGVLYVCTTAFLREMVGGWRRAAAERIEREFDSAVERSGSGWLSIPEHERFAALMEGVYARESLSGVDAVTIAIEVVTFAVDAAALIVALAKSG